MFVRQKTIYTIVLLRLNMTVIINDTESLSMPILPLFVGAAVAAKRCAKCNRVFFCNYLGPSYVCKSCKGDYT